MISPEHLIAYCQANVAIATAVGNATAKGFTGVPVLPEMSTAIAALMPRRAIVITSSGGPEFIGSTHNLVRGRQDVRCYGETMADAWALNQVVYNELSRKGHANMGGKTAVSVYASGGGLQDYDPDGDWPFVFVEYTIVISEG